MFICSYCGLPGASYVTGSSGDLHQEEVSEAEYFHPNCVATQRINEKTSTEYTSLFSSFFSTRQYQRQKFNSLRSITSITSSYRQKTSMHKVWLRSSYSRKSVQYTLRSL